MNTKYATVATRAGHRCEYCHAPEATFNFPFEVEHVRPVTAGGSDEDINLALGCRSCNLYKSARTTGIDPDTGKEVPLFNPRTDQWDKHFVVELFGSIAGTTAIGRATLERLRINSPKQIAARRLWVILRLFP